MVLKSWSIKSERNVCQRNNIKKRFTAGTICYKVLYNSSFYGYLSIYQRKPWTLGQIHRTGLYNHKLSSDEIKRYSKSIGAGFFHAFLTLEEAIRFQKSIWVDPSCNRFHYIITNFPIAEMRIPEDVDGFSGTYFDLDESFDSITVPILEFVKIVDQNVSNK